MKISICIPTRNRAALLTNCLQSIIVNRLNSATDFEVCVSDNGSTDETELVVRRAQKIIDIKYSKNAENLGIPVNFIKVVDMAEGDFVWLIGNRNALGGQRRSPVHKFINSFAIGRNICLCIYEHPLQRSIVWPDPKRAKLRGNRRAVGIGQF